MPTELMGVAHSRSPVVPFTPPLGGAATVLFAVDDGAPGHLHAIDASTGNRPWPPATQPLTTVGAPGGIFTLFGGVRDALFVGTRDNSVDNALRALSVTSGALLEAYAPSASPGPIGPIGGSPAIDYATRRIYFASHKRSGGDTLFCLEIGASSPVLSYRWSRDLGHVTGSPVLRGGRVYVGSDAGIVYSIEALDGLQANDRTYSTLDGPVKGFVFPDRRNDDLMFATSTKVWSLSDDGSATMALNWTFAPGGLNPGVVLYWPLTSFVYVGSANGELYELDFTSATPSTPPTFKLQVLGGGLGQVGAPSLDIGVTPRLLMVGSEPGVVYGLTIPFP
jgi:outer membrane protein assembly factor BamB